MSIKKYWLYSPLFDSLFFFSPFFITGVFTYGLIYYFPELSTPINSPLWFFLFTIIFDVGHVWGSIFRTYIDLGKWQPYRKILIGIPILSFLLLFSLALYGKSRGIGYDPCFIVLGWVAVYHFIRQQAGFTILYANREYEVKKDSIESIKKYLDTAIIWVVTGFPMIYWWNHYETSHIDWFIRGEFQLMADILPKIDSLWLIYCVCILVYIVWQLILLMLGRAINPLKLLYIFGTAFVWYNGIVAHNSVIIFGFGNMLLHGLNYYGIVIASTMVNIKNNTYQTWKYFSKILVRYGLVIIPIILILLGFIEEFFWDQLLWKDSGGIFGNILYDSSSSESILIMISISILGSIQLSHYILDRYIWKKDFGNIF